MEHNNEKETIETLKDINENLKNFLERSSEEQDLILDRIIKKNNFDIDEY